MSEDTNTVRLSYKNYEFEVTVDTDTYSKINSDKAYKEDFARQTYESLENDGHFMGDEETQEDSHDVKPPASSMFKWTKAAVDQLINVRFSKNDEFNTSKTRKSELWQSIARQLSENFPGVTGEMCDAKYRNLLHTFKLNKQKECRYGVETIKWEYFEQFNTNLDLYLPIKDTDCFDSIFEKDVEKDVGFRKEDLIGLDSPPESPINVPVKRKRSNNTMSINEYLQLKADNDVRSMRLKAKIWKEKKQLKEREIAAILQLAKALKSKK